MSGNKAIFCTRCGVQIFAPAIKYCPDCRRLAKQENDRARWRRARAERKAKAPEKRQENYYGYTVICEECGAEMVGVAANRRFCDDCREKRQGKPRKRCGPDRPADPDRPDKRKEPHHNGPRKDAGKPPETPEQLLQRHGGGLDYGKTVAREEGRIR